MASNYTIGDESKIKALMHQKVEKDFLYAKRFNLLDELMEKYEIVLDAKEEIAVDPYRCRILVIGALSCKLKDYQIRAKKLGFDINRIEFIDYVEAKSLDTEKFRNSQLYSDIIYGPVPHKLKGIGESSSFRQEMKDHPEEYPRVVDAKDNSNEASLKISITAFENCLKKTRYYRDVIEQIY